MTVVSARRPPRNATPKPAPPITAPARYATTESAAAATTRSDIPTASASDPNAAPAQGAARVKASCPIAAEPVRVKIPTLAVRWLAVWKISPDRWDPRERNSPAIDQDETAAREASRNGPRIEAGTSGRCGVSRGRDRPTT